MQFQKVVLITNLETHNDNNGLKVPEDAEYIIIYELGWGLNDNILYVPKTCKGVIIINYDARRKDLIKSLRESHIIGNKECPIKVLKNHLGSSFYWADGQTYEDIDGREHFLYEIKKILPKGSYFGSLINWSGKYFPEKDIFYMDENGKIYLKIDFKTELP